MSVCPSEEDLACYAAGDCDEARTAAIAAHLGDCDRCRTWVDRARADDAWLAGVHEAVGTIATNTGDAPSPDEAGAPTRTREADDEPPTEPPIEIEGYEILRELHRGGQGIVYQAIQKTTHRKVAIKVLLEGPFASERAKRRFEREIELVAQLRHPNIIAVFHSGRTADGRQYCVMDYVRGIPLDQYVHDHKLTLEDALKLFSTVCDAVNYAHQKGVIHRDLKPSNILVDSAGVSKVLDFGLAKQLAGPADSVVSLTSQVVGTLPYMSPEQARGNPDEIDIRTDVYALGVVLYQMLTGHYPYPVAGQMAEVLRHIAETPPTPPSRSWKSDSGVTQRSQKRVRPGQCPIDDEVQTIVLRTLAKERERRYQSAGELAKDIAHYLAGEAIEAKRDSGWYVLRKNLRRYKAPVTVAAGFVLLLAAFGIVISVYAAKQKQLAETNRQLADSERTARRKASRAKDEAVAARKAADARAESLRRALYGSSIARAQNAYDDNSIGRMKELLDQCPVDLRGWEWHRLTYLSDPSILALRGHQGPVCSVAFSPDGTRIVSGGLDKTVKVWDAATGEITLTLRGHEEAVHAVAFSPDGTRIVSGSRDKTVKLWNGASGAELLTLRGHENWVQSVAFSPDGTRIVSGGLDETVKVWDAATGEITLTLRGHWGYVTSVAFSPDGARIISGSRDKTVKVWDAVTGAELTTLRGHGASVTSVAFSPDGTRIVSGSWDKTVKLWDAATGTELTTLRGHEHVVHSVAFGPDGTRIVSGSDDDTVKVWNAATGNELTTLHAYEGDVASVAFSPDGTQIAVGSTDWGLPEHNRVQVWDAATGENALTLRGHEGSVQLAAFSPDGQRIVSGSGDKTVKVWDAVNGAELMTLRGHKGYVASVAFSPEGTRIVSGSEDNAVKVWNAATGDELLTLRGHTSGVTCVAFSPDGTRIISADSRTVKVWDAVNGAELMTLRGHKGCVASVAFSPEGTRIVAQSESRDEMFPLKVWDAATGDELLTLRGHASSVVSVAFSPDGTRIVSGSAGGTAKVWDAATGDELLTLRGHASSVASVAFSPDGGRIVSGSDDKTVKVWDAATGDELLTLRGHAGSVDSVAFSPDGTRIVSGSRDKTVKIWETKAPSPDVLRARQAAMATQRRIGSLHDQFRESSKLSDAAVNDGKTEVAGEHFAKMLTAADELAAADPDDPLRRYKLAQTYDRLARLASEQGNQDEGRKWAMKHIQALRALAEHPRTTPADLSSAAWELLTAEPTDLRDPQGALEFALKANDRTDHSNPAYLDTLALAYHRTGDTARAIEIEEKALALLNRGDSMRKELEARLAEFRRAAATQPADIVEQTGE